MTHAKDNGDGKVTVDLPRHHSIELDLEKKKPDKTERKLKRIFRKVFRAI